MKRKFILTLIGLVLVISFLPLAVSQDNPGEPESLKEKLAKERHFAEFKRDKLHGTELKEEVLDIFRILDEKELAKIMSLSEEKIFKLAELRQEHIKKLSQLSINNLRKIISLDKQNIGKLMDLEATKLEKFSYLDRARIVNLSDSDNLDEELDKIEIKISEDVLFFNKRIVSSKKIKDAEKNFQIAEQNLIELKKRLDSEKKLLKLAKQNNDELGVREHSKRFIITAADAIMNHLYKIKSKIQQSQSIDDKEEKKLVKDILDKIDEIESIKPGIESNLTIEEIKIAAKKLNCAWARIRIKSEFYVIILVNHKIDEAIKRSEYLENKLETILTEFEENSLKISDIEEELTGFSHKINRARLDFKNSLEYFRKAKSTGIRKDLQKAILTYKQYSELAQGELREAHEILKKIIKMIREKDKTANLGRDISEVIIIKERYEQPFVDIEIEGFLETSEQKITNELIENLYKTKTNSYIRIIVVSDDENYELKKEVKGDSTDEQNAIINSLVNDLENVDGKVEIKISSGEVK